MTEFLNTYGIWAAFFLALLENDVAFIAVGVVAKLGDNNPFTPDLNLYSALPAAIAGALLHDSFWFALGHFHSDWFKSSSVYRRVGPTVERLAQRFGIWQIFLARFIYGTRNPSSVFWGIQKLPYWKFLAIEALSLTVWSSLMVAIAFHSTGRALQLIGKVQAHHHTQIVVITVLVAFLLVAGLRTFTRWKLGRRQAR